MAARGCGGVSFGCRSHGSLSAGTSCGISAKTMVFATNERNAQCSKSMIVQMRRTAANGARGLAHPAVPRRRIIGRASYEPRHTDVGK